MIRVELPEDSIHSHPALARVGPRVLLVTHTDGALHGRWIDSSSTEPGPAFELLSDFPRPRSLALSANECQFAVLWADADGTTVSIARFDYRGRPLDAPTTVATSGVDEISELAGVPVPNGHVFAWIDGTTLMSATVSTTGDIDPPGGEAVANTVIASDVAVASDGASILYVYASEASDPATLVGHIRSL